MNTPHQPAIAIVLARAGSKGVPGKNTAVVGGKPCVRWTLEAALSAKAVGRVLVSSDDEIVLRIAASMGALPVRRPSDLASDSARIDDASRHALENANPASRDSLPCSSSLPVVILYANVPIRPAGLIDRAVNMLRTTGADSVQSYAPAGKHHPWWTARLAAEGEVSPWQGEVLNNGVYRRQDLPPAVIPDGGVLVVTRGALFRENAAVPEGPHAFFGLDRRGILNDEGAVSDTSTLPETSRRGAVHAEERQR